MLQLIHDLVEIEALRLLSRRIILECGDEFRGEFRFGREATDADIDQWIAALLRRGTDRVLNSKS